MHDIVYIHLKYDRNDGAMSWMPRRPEPCTTILSFIHSHSTRWRKGTKKDRNNKCSSLFTKNKKERRRRSMLLLVFLCDGEVHIFHDLKTVCHNDNSNVQDKAFLWPFLSLTLIYCRVQQNQNVRNFLWWYK